MSPVFFILVSLLFTSLMLSGIFFIAWRTLVHEKHALTWAIAFLFASVQWSVNLLVDAFPSAELYWVVVSAVTLATLTLAMVGHYQRVEKPLSVLQLWGSPLACFGAIVWFTYGAPHFGLRVGLGPAYGAGTLLISATLILQHREKSRPAEWGAAVTMVVFGVTQLIAAWIAVAQGATLNPEYSQAYYLVNFLTLPAAYTGMGMFVVFVLASDLSEMMREAAVHDQLTGHLNRRGFNEAAARTFATARRTQTPISVIMADIDAFKEINDQHGHLIGDHALQHFAELLAQHRRADDVLARVGGEEFALVLPGCELVQAQRIAQDVCTYVENTPMDFDGRPLQMTASFGVAALCDRDTCLADVIVRSDAALYQAKHNGRNRVESDGTAIATQLAVTAA